MRSLLRSLRSWVTREPVRRSTGNRVASRPYAPRSGAGRNRRRSSALWNALVSPARSSRSPQRGCLWRAVRHPRRTSARRSSLCRPPAASRAPEKVRSRSRPPSWHGLARARTRLDREVGEIPQRIVHARVLPVDQVDAPVRVEEISRPRVVVAGHEGSGRGLKRHPHRPRPLHHLVVSLRQRRPPTTQEVQVTVNRGENVEAGSETPPETVNPLERPRGPNRRPRVPAKPVPGVHGDPFDEPGHHRAVCRVEEDHLRVDSGLSRDPRVVLLGLTVYILRRAFPGEPQRVSRPAYCDLVRDVGEPAAEEFDLETSLWDVPEKRHACQRGIHSIQSYSSPYLLLALTNARDAVERL